MALLVLQFELILELGSGPKFLVLAAVYNKETK